MRPIPEIFDNLQIIDKLEREVKIEELFETLEKEEADRILNKAMAKIEEDSTISINEESARSKKFPKRFGKKKLAFAILVAALIGTISVSAHEGNSVEKIVEVIENIVIKKPLAEKVHMEPEEIEETPSIMVENIEEEDKTEAECDGVVVSVEQIVSDGEDAYVYLSVEFPENLGIESMCEEGILYFRQNEVKIGDRKPERAGCVIQRESKQKGYVVVHVQLENMEENSYEVSLTLNNLDFAITSEDRSSRDIQRIVEGSWNLQWNMSCKKITKQLPLEAVIDAHDGIVTTEYAVLSPLSLRIVGTIECDDPQYSQTSCFIDNVILKDGTLEDYDASYSQIEEGTYIMKCYFKRMIPMEDIIGVVVNNEYLYF